MHFLCLVYLTTVKKFQNLQGCVWKASQAWLGGKSCFSHTDPSNFQRPLQLLLWNIRLKIYWLPKFDMLFQLLLTNFSKSELFLCLQKVDHVTNYCKKKKLGEWEVWVRSTSEALKLWLLLPCLTLQAPISKYKFSTPVSIISRENLIKDQSISPLFIILLILLTFSFDDVLI